MANPNWEEVMKKALIETLINCNLISSWDIVKFCAESSTTRNLVEDFVKKIKKTNLKNSSLALNAKEKGNKSFRKMKYQESLFQYTRCILLAEKNDECLSLAYSNRSAVLQRMGYPSESISDIDMALACGYPKEKTEILMLRKSKCLVELGEVEKAKKVLQDTLRNSEKKEFHQLIKNELKEIKNLKNRNNINFEDKLPEVVGGENENFVSSSKHLSVYFDKAKGRHVIATKDLEIGDVLIVERPFAYVIFKACCNCGKNTIAPIPCWNCSDACYCSPECRDNFWKVHSFECGFTELFSSMGVAYLSLRIILKASSNLDELKKVLNNISEPKYEKGIVMHKSNGYDGVYNLLHHIEKLDLFELYHYAMISLLLAVCLKNLTNYFPAISNHKDLGMVTSVICRHTLQLICNGQTITDVSDSWTDEMNGINLNRGTAIYVSASMMNHSCESSVSNFFHDNWLIVRAIKPIKKGEEIFSNYGNQAYAVKRSIRQKMLRDQYFFDCKCQRCLETVDIMDKLTAFKCIYCKGPFILKSETSRNIICIDCGKTLEYSEELRKEVDKFYSLIKEGKHENRKKEGAEYLEISSNNKTPKIFLYGRFLCINDTFLALKKFLKAWWIGRNLFYKFHEDLAYAAEEIANCFAVLEDLRKSISFLKCIILSIEKRFGPVSFQLAGMFLKLGHVTLKYSIYNKENLTRELVCNGVLYYQKAERIFTLLCGPDYKTLDIIKTNKAELEKILCELED